MSGMNWENGSPTCDNCQGDCDEDLKAYSDITTLEGDWETGKTYRVEMDLCPDCLRMYRRTFPIRVVRMFLVEPLAKRVRYLRWRYLGEG